jgi:type II secretion system protein J
MKLRTEKLEARRRCREAALRRRFAFTLIEMILAIGVAALVLIAVNTVLFSALHLHEATADMVDAATPVDAAVTFLKRDLQCAMTPTNGTSKLLSGSFKLGTVNAAGVGEPVAAEFYTATGALGANAPWADVQRVTYELKNATDVSGRRDLYRSVTRNLLSTATLDVEDQLMLSGVENVRFSGYDGSQWQTAWDTSDVTSLNTNLPLAVRVEIQLANNGGAQLAPIQLVVPIDSVSRTNMVLTGNSGS